jgi:microcin C transport system permease protein
MPATINHSTRKRSLSPYARILACALGLTLAVSLAAPLIANDRPLIITYRGQIFLPVFQNLSGRTFGPTFLPTLADYGNPETIAAITAHGRIIWPLIPYRYDTMVWHAKTAPSPPSPQDWLGTDGDSRDVLAQTVYALRISCLYGFAITLAAAALGTLAGAVQGYYGGKTDLLLQRATEIWSGIPQFFLIIILASIFTPSLWSLFVFLLLFSWLTLASRVRAESLRTRNLDYVRAAQALGAPHWHIIRRHILPNAMVAVFTFLPFIFAESIILLTGLDFLGFGQKPGSPSLGELLLQAKDNPQAPWLGITIFVALGGLLTLLISLGGALRNTPKFRRTI